MSPIIPSEPSNERAAHIAGLREFADWLEANPSVREPQGQCLLLALSKNPAVEAFAAEYGMTVDYDDEGNASCELSFGPIRFHVYGYVDFDAHRERVAERDAREWADRNGMSIQPDATKGGAR